MSKLCHSHIKFSFSSPKVGKYHFDPNSNFTAGESGKCNSQKSLSLFCKRNGIETCVQLHCYSLISTSKGAATLQRTGHRSNEFCLHYLGKVNESSAVKRKWNEWTQREIYTLDLESKGSLKLWK